MKLTVIVPAFNEESYVAADPRFHRGRRRPPQRPPDAVIETIVVDNNSEDGTAAIARAKGATVIDEPLQGIARARNAGARHADGDVLVFVDADVIVPPTLLEAIHAAMSDPACLGGGVDVDYRPRRRTVRLYLRAWRLLARLTGMAQGATQFCRASVFEEVGGYDETAWIGEDVDFHWSLKRLARKTDRTVAFIRHPRVRPSARRFDKWPLWAASGLDEPALHRAAAPPQGAPTGLVHARGAVETPRPARHGPDRGFRGPQR